RIGCARPLNSPALTSYSGLLGSLSIAPSLPEIIRPDGFIISLYHQCMNESLPLCPECSSEHAYVMAALLICPICGHEWTPDDQMPEDGIASAIRDAVGNVLSDGDTVTVTTSVKVKRSAQGIKAGTKVRNIRLI